MVKSKQPNKYRLGEIAPGKIAVFETPKAVPGAVATDKALLTLQDDSPRTAKAAQLLLAAPQLLASLEALLEYVDPFRKGDNQYNAALIEAKAATIFAKRRLDLETVLFREELLHTTLEELTPDSRLQDFVTHQARPSDFVFNPTAPRKSFWRRLFS